MPDFRSGVSLAAEYGGPDVDIISDVLTVNRTLQEYCKGPYGDAISGFPLVLRVDGAIKKYGGHGIERIRIHLKQKYVTGDICIPEIRWRGVPRPQLRQYIWQSVQEALKECANAVLKRGLALETDKLWCEFRNAQSHSMMQFPIGDSNVM